MAAVSRISSLINLIPQQTLREEKLLRISSFARQTSFVIIGAYLIVLVAAGAIFFVFQLRKTSLLAENRNLASQIEALRETEAKLFTLKERAKIISSIFQRGEKKFTKPLSVVSSLAPPGVVVTEVTRERAVVSVSFQAQDTFTLDSFLDALKESNQFLMAKLNNLTRTPSGFFVSVELEPLE